MFNEGMNVSICSELIINHICFIGARITIARIKFTITPEVIDESINLNVFWTVRIRVVLRVYWGIGEVRL